MFWLNNAPIYDPNEKNKKNHDRACAFIDTFITTNSKTPGCEKFIQLQRHSHTKSCKHQINVGAAFCRFNIPYPPMLCTQILHPLDKKNILNKTLKEYEKKL